MSTGGKTAGGSVRAFASTPSGAHSFALAPCLDNRRPLLRLAQHERDLSIRELRLLHRHRSVSRPNPKLEFSSSGRSRHWAAGQSLAPSRCSAKTRKGCTNSPNSRSPRTARLCRRRRRPRDDCRLRAGYREPQGTHRQPEAVNARSAPVLSTGGLGRMDEHPPAACCRHEASRGNRPRHRCGEAGRNGVAALTIDEQNRT